MNPTTYFPSRSALMESMDAFPSHVSIEPRSVPDVTVTTEEFTSLKLHTVADSICCFHLLDGDENLMVSTASKFACYLGCPDNVRVKVVSIVGNTGDGKSYTLNKVFFKGGEVFKTSNEQTSCTMGVWAAFDPCMNVIVLDTEGLLGATKEKSKRSRLLIKILAVSDVVIYRTRAERLHSDMFTFLGSASWAFTEHFHGALSSLISREGLGGKVSALGPAVIIFHETRDTLPLRGSTETVDEVVRRMFISNKAKIDAFSSLRYIGTQSKGSSPTNFSKLINALQTELSNTCVRSTRHTGVVYETLKVLNDKFSGVIVDPRLFPFPDHYFTCASKCLSCNQRCEASMGHLKDDQPHISRQHCCFQAQFNNVLYTCKACHMKGQQVVVVSSEPSWLGLASYAWTGYTIDCPYCGQIYCSRKYWYGNKNPEDAAVRTEITHVWAGSNSQLISANAAQKVLDGVSLLSDAVASVGSQPARYLSSCVADMIAPKYWRPNHEIKSCHGCKKEFGAVETKHHCRACGEGFCDSCSKNKRPVPEKGWMDDVRVCNICYAKGNEADTHVSSVDDQDLRARKYGEVVVNTLSSVAAVLEYPRELIKDSARPSYWVPSHEAKVCAVCQEEFSPLRTLHHCRDCGQAVCQECSPNKKVIPSRGWEYRVRVCVKCCKSD